jgi:hypothetical protein
MTPLVCGDRALVRMWTKCGRPREPASDGDRAHRAAVVGDHSDGLDLISVVDAVENQRMPEQFLGAVDGGFEGRDSGHPR